MTNKLSYRPDIDGLRAVAVLAVIASHLPEKFLPSGFRWSPEGHLLAFGQKTDQYGRILVVLNPDKPKDRIVLTGPQVRELLEQLDEQNDGLTPAARLDYPSAIADGPADESSAEDGETPASDGE